VFNKIKSKFYDLGFSQGWQSGFETGTQATRDEAKKVFIKALTKEIKTGNMDYIDGLERAIQIIKEQIK